METLKDIFVPYEIAQKLKEIGFDKDCIFYYSQKEKIHCLTPNRTEQNRVIDIEEIDNHNANESEDPFCSAPTYEQVFKWFREKGYHIIIDKVNERFAFFIRQKNRIDAETNAYTYEEAREQSILKTIEIYKNM